MDPILVKALVDERNLTEEEMNEVECCDKRLNVIESGYYLFPGLYKYVCSAMKKNNLNTIKSFLNCGLRSNYRLSNNGEFSGFRPLHLASLLGTGNVVEMLIKDYGADVNIAADNGVQPIHLACLFDDQQDVLRHLLEAGANANAVMTREFFKFYHNENDDAWCSDFDDEMSLLTFAIIYKSNSPYIAETLIEFNADLTVKSQKNTTLLMYAVEYGCANLAEIFKSKKEYRELVHARDDEGFHAIHYLLHPKKYNGCRFHSSQLGTNDDIKKECMKVLIELGVDIYATINNDPDTLILNMASWRASPGILQILLPHSSFLARSKAFYNVTLTESKLNTLTKIESLDPESQKKLVKHQWLFSFTIVLIDFINRLTFGSPIPEDEKNLMVHSYATKEITKIISDNYKNKFIEQLLKKTTIQNGDGKSITHFDFLMKSYNDKKLRVLVRDKTLINNWISSSIRQHEDYQYFNYLLRWRMRIAIKRNALLDELKKLSQLTKAIPLPFECVLDLIEYLNNQDFEKLISAFYETFSLNKIDEYIF